MFLYYLRVAALSVLALSPAYSLYSSEREVQRKPSTKEKVASEKATQKPPVKYSMYSRKASENPDTLLFVAPDPRTNKPAVFLMANTKGGYWSAFPVTKKGDIPGVSVKEKITQGPLKGTRLYISRIPAHLLKNIAKENKDTETMWLPIDELSPMAAISRPLSSGKKSLVDPTLQNLIKAYAPKIKAIAMSPEPKVEKQPETQRESETRTEPRGQQRLEKVSKQSIFPWTDPAKAEFNKDDKGPWFIPNWREDFPYWEEAPFLDPRNIEETRKNFNFKLWLDPNWEGWKPYGVKQK